MGGGGSKSKREDRQQQNRDPQPEKAEVVSAPAAAQESPPPPPPEGKHHPPPQAAGAVEEDPSGGQSVTATEAAVTEVDSVTNIDGAGFTTQEKVQRKQLLMAHQTTSSSHEKTLERRESVSNLSSSGRSSSSAREHQGHHHHQHHHQGEQHQQQGARQKKKKVLNGSNIEFRYPSGSKYVGGFRDGKLHGYGKYLYFPSGDEYEGEWWNDMKHGHGTYVYESGDKYVGEWRYGKKHGKGNYTFASGDEYVGSWKADRIHGYGVFIITRNGNRYEGEWEDSYRHGYGVLASGNGDRYEGHWFRGKEEGHGILSYANGSHYCGEWKLGQMDGKGVMLDNGSRHLVEHISGYMISNVVVSPDEEVDPEWAAVWQLADLHEKKLNAGKLTLKSELASSDPNGGTASQKQSDLLTELEKVKLEKDVLERKYNELLSSSSAPEVSPAEVSTDAAELREKLTSLLQQVSSDAIRLKEYQAREETTKATLQELQYTKQKLLETGAELGTLRKEVEKAREAAASSPPADNKTVARLEAELEQLRQQRAAKGDVLELQAKLALVEAEAAGKAATEKELAAALEVVESLRREAEAWKAREGDLLGEITGLKGRVRQLEEQVEASEAHHREEAGVAAAEVRQQMEEKELRLKELEEKNKKTKKKAKDLEARLKASEAKEEEAKRTGELLAESRVKVSSLETEKANLAELCKAEKTKSRKLFNTIEDMKGKIRVYARTRPFLATEKSRNDSSVLMFTDDMAMAVYGERMKEKKEFFFDTCFRGDASQEKVFEDCRHLIQSAVDGYNVCVFAYGQTGSGKTFTLAGTPEDPGVAPRSMSELFDVLTSNPNLRPSITCYMVELYNDKLFDLLRTDQGTDPARLEIKKDSRGFVTIQGVTVREAPTLSELTKLYQEGQQNRHTRATKMNDVSSRSHLVFSIVIETSNVDTKQAALGKLSIVDLAGSERLAKTGLEDPTAVSEAQNINLSLTALGNVISALSSGKGHVPYRDNKLTMLMSDSLGGNAKTLMFVNISPSGYNLDETINSLNYASRVKLIKNTPSKAIVTAEIRKLRAAVEKLKQGINVDIDYQEVEDIGSPLLEDGEDVDDAGRETPSQLQPKKKDSLAPVRSRASRTPSPNPSKKDGGV